MEKIAHHKAIVLGAGPAGLAVAATLLNKQVDTKVLESTDKVASSWRKHYDRLCLHTVKQYSGLPFYPIPEKYPTYLTRDEVVEYLESYAERFKINPHFNFEVRSIEKNGELWQIKSKEGYYSCDKIIICSGINRVPYTPNWNGMESYAGEIMHSRLYKNPDPFKHKKVLVVGMGNTGAEIALDLSNHDIEVDMSVRSEVNIVPRDLNGRPSQITAKQLEKIPFNLGVHLGNFVKNLAIGDLRKYGLKTSKVPPVVQLKETGKTPVLDLGTVKRIKEGKVIIKGDFDGFTEKGVIYKSGEEKEYGAIILATGYRAKIEEFTPGVESQYNHDNIPKSWKGEGDFNGMYFCGFDNYKLGGILGTIQTNSQQIANDIQ